MEGENPPEHQPLSRYEVGSVMKATSGKSIPGAVVRYEVPGVAVRSHVVPR